MSVFAARYILRVQSFAGRSPSSPSLPSEPTADPGAAHA